ncbi:MAG: CAP domain-containing protein [Gaiellaceae bacterium]
MKRRVVILLTVAAAVCAAGAAAAPERSQHHAGIALPLVEGTNALRAQHGLTPVRPAPSLRLAALAHTRLQVARGAFTHDSPDGSSFSDRIARFYGQQGFSRWGVGENLLYGPVDISPDEALRIWLESPAHRKILLEPSWRDIGIVALAVSRAPGEFGGHDVVVITSDFGIRSR